MVVIINSDVLLYCFLVRRQYFPDFDLTEADLTPAVTKDQICFEVLLIYHGNYQNFPKYIGKENVKKIISQQKQI